MGWINIKDKLPNTNQWCLFWYGGKVPMIGNYRDDGKFIELDSMDVLEIEVEGITHWMPIPEPPKD